MSAYRFSPWTRRETLRGLAAAVGTGCLGFGAPRAAAEPPPEVTTIRLLGDLDTPILCYAPQYLAEEFLRLEGFTDIQYRAFGQIASDSGPLIEDLVDITAGLGSDFIANIDSGAPIVVLSGLHAGCVEVFASDRVTSINDLAGKKLLSTQFGGPEHISLSSVVAFVGLDPLRDVEWIWEPDYGRWPELLAAEEVDVVQVFPPLNLTLRDNGVGHVILNTTIDDPWRHFFCCMVAGRRDFVQKNPVSTKRVIRALVKANQLCELDRTYSAQRLVDLGVTDRYDYALRTLEDVPYGAWRNYDPTDTIRFYSLRLREAGLVRNTPSKILELGSDFRFLDEIRQELKL